MRKDEAMKALKNAQGQMNAVMKMMEDDRYCIDVSYQVLATIALLKKANDSLLKQHMEHCVIEAFEEGNGQEKIDEVIKLMHKMIG
ncbi:metal-sensing transcriptional repressor [Erysipelothrix urinaevulpis]|uniref:metal-sensing transcriptional repressor n=1 Tax=Erysipelothrix urinaevulpis TaxID=2683717 RepID=UPI001358D021|nr:metal-sensing transcriptional repressor [Erysipelothrix urinaevulpis]